MSEINNSQELKNTPRKKLNRKLDAVGCGLFFIWMGIAILANVGWGIGLIGVGTLILGRLVAREYLSGSSGCGTTKADNLAKSL